MSSRDGSSEPMPYVYITSEDHAWVPARVIHSDGNKATVVVQKYKNEPEMLVNTEKISGLSIREKTVDLREYPNGVLPMQNTDDRGKLGYYEDMVNLPYLHEVRRDKDSFSERRYPLCQLKFFSENFLL